MADRPQKTPSKPAIMVMDIEGSSKFFIFPFSLYLIKQINATIIYWFIDSMGMDMIKLKFPFSVMQKSTGCTGGFFLHYLHHFAAAAGDDLPLLYVQQLVTNGAVHIAFFFRPDYKAAQAAF